MAVGCGANTCKSGVYDVSDSRVGHAIRWTLAGDGSQPLSSAARLGISEIAIHEGVTVVSKCLFSGSTKLLDVTLPESATEIGYWAFSGCTRLTRITIPRNVSVVGGRFYSGWDDYYYPAFSGCAALRDVTIMAPTPPVLHGTNFEIENDTLHVPAGSLDAYRNSDWNRCFTTILEQRTM